MLSEILSSYISDLRMEIAGTESMDFREAMKKERGVSERTSSTSGKRVNLNPFYVQSFTIPDDSRGFRCGE